MFLTGITLNKSYCKNLSKNFEEGALFPGQVCSSLPSEKGVCQMFVSHIESCGAKILLT